METAEDAVALLPATATAATDADADDVAKARVLSQLLQLLCADRRAADEGDGSRSAEEREVARQLMRLPRAAQQQVAQALFALRPALLGEFARVLQFFVRVVVEAHAASHEIGGDDGDGDDSRRTRSCGWTTNGHVGCYETTTDSSNSSGGGDATPPPPPTTTTTFRLPPDFLACVVERLGSVRRSKCEEVWHGDHMAYRCRTCGLSDSSCMCLGCFDPDDHDGHDYRVYRCSSGGCCDCGDPLAWRPEGFCKKHSAAAPDAAAAAAGARATRMGPLERETVTLLVRRTIGFCVDVLREVYLFCLRPGGAYNSDPLYPLRSLPKTGRRRNCFPDGTQVFLDRVQQTLAWLQMLATSCVAYRDIITEVFFEPLPSDFQLDPPLITVASTPAASLGDRAEDQAENSSSRSSHSTAATSSEPPRAAHAGGGGDLLVIDVFLKAGILLPVETCDALGVLYLKLLFDQGFKQKYTCHFVEWYPYFIELYLKASEENNDEGMRSLSRFIDRLFCQLFHSTAQLRELERLFSSSHGHEHRFRQPLSASRHSSSCIEWLMLFLLEKLNGLFRSATRVESLRVKRERRSVDGAAVTESEESTTLQHVVDCGRSVFKKRVYARLCSDLRTLLVHPQVAADAVLNSFYSVAGGNGELVLDRKSVYGELIETFRVLQQMDLQKRHVGQHIEYESLNWTLAFVVDYEVNLLLHAFLSGIPLCFSRAETSPVALAKALLKPVRETVLSWTRESGCPEWTPSEAFVEASSKSERLWHLIGYYEGVAASRQDPVKKSFHLPLHHMYASLIHTLCLAIRPQTVPEWRQLLSCDAGGESESSSGADVYSLSEVEFALSLVEFPLRVCFFTREVKAGLWVRNGNAMWQQLTHYYSKHWRFYGVHSDLYLCQLGALLAPRGSFTRVFLRHLPLDLRDSTVFSLAGEENDISAKAPSLADVRRELDIAEEMLRLLIQIALSPVKSSTSIAPVESLTYLLEREMMHWLSLGPFARSEVITRVDVKLVEHVKQLPEHPWYLLEEEEILAQVLESVGLYEEAGPGLASSVGSGGGLLNLGLKMSGSWKLKPELWAKISPYFECFTPSEAQQCEQNLRSNLSKSRASTPLSSSTPSETSVLAVPILPGLHPEALRLHVGLATAIFNSTALMSALFLILQNWKRRERTRSVADRDTANENLLLAALQCIFVGVQLLEPPSDDVAESEALSTFNSSKQGGIPVGAGASIDQVARYFADDLSFITNLCSSVPVSENDEHSASTLLSLLIEFAATDAPLEDARSLAAQILCIVSAKSSACRLRVEESRAFTVDSVTVAGGGEDSARSSGVGGEDAARSAKEMARRRQQLILEKMRSKQMQFLSSHGGEQSKDLKTVQNEYGTVAKEVDYDDNGSDAGGDDDDEDDDDDDDDEDEEDEWGFPTGQIDVQLYLDHVSSAIAVSCEKEKKFCERQRRHRRSLRHRASGSDEGAVRRSQSLSGSAVDDDEEDAEECALCRMPCERFDAPSSFGYVGMVLPTRIPQRMRELGTLSTPPLPAVRVVRSRAREEASSVRLSDATIWSCGHPLHHDCLKSYVSSLWKQKRPSEIANGDERLLSERDVEFQCPICRRLSNCLVPSVPHLGSLDRQLSSQGIRRGSSSTRALSGETREGEAKHSGDDDDDAQENLVFVKWLSSQMSFQDDLPQVQRRKSRSTSFLRSRLNSSVVERDRLGAVERSIDRFYHAITLRCLRAAMQLPLLLDGSIQDESQIDTEIEDASCALDVQLPAWQLLVQCLEVQVGLVVQDGQLSSSDAPEKQRMQSMRRLAEVTVAACAMSAQNTLSWSVIDAPYDSKFDVVVSKLNAILFGHQVLFEEDDDEWDDPSESAADKHERPIDVRGAASPVLSHSNLFSFFVARMVWRQGAQTTSPDVAVEELTSEAFFLARVLVTAQLLQSLCRIVMRSAETVTSDEEFVVGINNVVKPDPATAELHSGDFTQVQSLRDAYRWVARLLSRCKLVSKAPPPKWSSIEEEASAACLPLVKRIVVLMEVLLPSSSLSHTGSSSDEPCAVCDGIFSDTLQPESKVIDADSSTLELEKHLRRLHLPPLRLFFRAQMFSSDQRGLCQLWGAQLEAKSAVLRQREATRPWSSGLFSALALSVTSPSDKSSRKRLLITLPRIYMNLFIAYSEKPRGVCQQCKQTPQHPAICLLCGVILCCYSSCCESARGNVGECSQHAQACGLGLGAFMLLRACTVILFLGNERRCVWGSVYVDKNGEEDPYLRRGKTLYLDESRVLALESLLVSHGFSQNTAILLNTSRRDGRRY